MATFRVVSPADSLRRSPSGGDITGNICIDFNGQCFPEQVWSDFAVTIVGCWLDSVCKLSDGLSKSEVLSFMDGPFELAVECAAESNRLQLQFMKRDNQVMYVGECSLDELRLGLLEGGESLVLACGEKGWSGPEIDVMRVNLRRLRTLVAHH